MGMRKNLASVAAVGVLAITATTFSTTTAAADPNYYPCPANSFCLYYNSNQQGAMWYTTSAEPNLDGYLFLYTGNGNGAYKPVKNNAASFKNNMDVQGRVWYSSGYRGVYDSFGSVGSTRMVGNLVNTYNENASISMGGF
ncbi:peptidase inhibitor family I36 protein [Streptomyces lavendulae]|uniref:peptidase inhibitor family I36 protein n=1 Tax=Streptomyces lavendulae TaxID=1914 RepID=UPI0033CB353A